MLNRKLMIVLCAALAMLCLLPGKGVAVNYDGDITPITTPTLFRYAPGELENFVVRTTTKGAGQPMDMSMNLNMAVAESGEDLKWDIIVPQIKVNGQTIKQDVSFYEVVCTTDRRGLMGDFDISFPALEKMGKPVKPGSPQYEQTKNSIGNTVSQFCEKEIVSGEMLYTMNTSAFGQIKSGKKEIGPTLLGYSEYDGRKVVVAQMEEEGLKVAAPGNSGTMTLSFVGYSLFDETTMLPVKSEMDITMKVGGQKVKMRVTGDIK